MAALQVLTSHFCIVIHLNYFEDRRLPLPVNNLREGATIIKCGVGVSVDREHLHEEQGISLRTALDVELHVVYIGLVLLGGSYPAALVQAIRKNE